MRVYVINLRSRDDRRQSVVRQFESLQLEYEFFPGVDGTNALKDHFTGVSNWRFLLETGHFAAKNEIGCYASHLLLWKRCIDLNEPIVILEDDFQRLPAFEYVLQQAEEWIEDCGYIRLEPMEARWSKKRNLAPVPVCGDDSCRLLYQPMPSVLATCYAIAPGCARAFVANSARIVAPVDHVIRRHWVHRQPIFAIEPAAAAPDTVNNVSSIGGRHKTLVRHLISPVRLGYRYLERRRAVAAAARQQLDIPATLGPARESI